MEHPAHPHHAHTPALTPNKYAAALERYSPAPADAEVAVTVARLLADKAAANHTLEVKKLLFGCIDLTSLNTTDNDEHILHFTRRVNDFDSDYPDLPHVAALCVYPNFAEVVRDTLEVEAVHIACVSAGFPSSQTFTEVKIAETALALADGADEIDIVLSVGRLLAGDYESVCDEIQELKECCKEAHLKVILETGALGSAGQIRTASLLAMYSGADFIKTSTGKMQPAATPEAAYVMCQAIRDYYEQTGIRVGFKPAGGLNSVGDAIHYYTIVKEILGQEWLDRDLFRLGTSRLANLLLSDILGEETNYF
ncbi:MAG: deoxyribose-phosphate aldolase [Prevotellaceae bacterium]|jgi:deoxyribose-phosphate aldolase|nr:deoxyribose-phosphate aldolase [Prevotellaceae bacterium]